METDKLYMNIGEGNVIEVGHPPAPVDVQHWWRASKYYGKYI